MIFERSLKAIHKTIAPKIFLVFGSFTKLTLSSVLGRYSPFWFNALFDWPKHKLVSDLCSQYVGRN